MKRFFIHSILSNWVRYFISIAIAFFLTPFIVHTLGNQRYGIWALLMSLSGYYGLLQLGIRPAITKYVAEYNAKEDKKSLNEIVNTSLITCVIIGFICFAVACLISILFFEIFKITVEDRNTIQLVVILTGLDIALGLIFGVFGAVIVACKRFVLINAINISFLSIRSILILRFLSSGHGLVAMALIWLISHLCQNLVTCAASFKVCPALKINLRFANYNTLKRIFSFSVYTFIASISKRIINYADTIVTGIFIGVEQVTYYAIAESLIKYGVGIQEGIKRVIPPITSELDALDEKRKLQQVVVNVSKVTLVIALYISIVFFLLGKSFINLWMGPGYGLTYIILCILAIPRVVIMSQNILRVTLIGMGKVRFIGLLGVIEAAMNIILSIILAWQYGVVGIAVATLITLIFTRGLLVPLYGCRNIGITIRQYLIQSILPPFYSALPCSIFTALMVRYIELNSYSKLLIPLVTSGVMMIGLSFYFCCDKYLRLRVYELLRNVFFLPKKVSR